MGTVAVDALQNSARPKVATCSASADAVRLLHRFNERQRAASPTQSSTCPTTCKSAPATLLAAHMMSHVPADVRCALCVADMSESIYHLGLQLSAAFHRLQAAVAARRGGRGVAALENAASAHAHVSTRSREPLKCSGSAILAAVGRDKLLPACSGWPQNLCRGCGRLWRAGMTVACVFQKPLLRDPPRLAENRSLSPTVG